MSSANDVTCCSISYLQMGGESPPDTEVRKGGNEMPLDKKS